MERDEKFEKGDYDDKLEKSSAVNNLILEYYKKFGKKRDLEQFFSLSTAQNEIRDPSSSFWRKMKALSDSSDSGEKKSESSTELCRISIKCSIPEPSGLQVPRETVQTTESDSPPIINEILEEKNSDNESEISDDVHSLKSKDGTLDTSMNKPHSPTSSVTSQRKLEWDSLADVGYGNESDKKTSASSLSTLERLALQQQYCINDTQHNDLGVPTAHSTPLEPNDSKSKGKKDLIKKTTKIFNKDVDHVQLTLPNIPETSQAFNLNLTKHITFNVDKKGEVNIENVTKNISSSPEKVSVETEMTQQLKIDREIQTTLLKEDKCSGSNDIPTKTMLKFPVHVNLNTLRKRNRRKKLKKVRRKHKEKRQAVAPTELNQAHKSGEQISAAESFEYMPGHIYHQNQINNDHNQLRNVSQVRSDNKSSLESSAGHTTDSSKDKNSFVKDLEKSIDLLKITLNKKHTDEGLKKKLIKEIVQRLLKSKYKDDESTTDFLSGLSFDSKKLDLAGGNHTTTSTSDPNDTGDKKLMKPKKSILRTDKFNSNVLPSTSQSTPNLPSVINNDIHIHPPTKVHATSNTNSDISGKYTKASSEELYQKYLKALHREQAYKQHLKEKELLFKQKLVGSDIRINSYNQPDQKAQNRIKDLMKDLIRNNYDDGSGDASRLEGGSNTHLNIDVLNPLRKQRSHSIFTLSSGTSDSNKKNMKLKNRDPVEVATASCSKNEKHYCCCPYHTSHGKFEVTDSSVQVNLQCCDKKQIFDDGRFKESPKCSHQVPHITPDSKTRNIQHVCLCPDKHAQNKPDSAYRCRCTHFINSGLKIQDRDPQSYSQPCFNLDCGRDHNTACLIPTATKTSNQNQTCERKCINTQESSSSKSSQTNLDLERILRRKSSLKSVASSLSDNVPSLKEDCHGFLDTKAPKKQANKIIHEAIRWTQTEISINPKISDPSFSDIVIIDTKDCAKLISKQCREISPLTSENSMKTCIEEFNIPSHSKDNSQDKDTLISKQKSPKTISVNKSSAVLRLDKEIQSDVDLSTFNNVGSQVNMPKLKNFTIPIQGTNMTLKVSLGNSESSSTAEIDTPLPDKSNQEFITHESKETLTNKPVTVDNSTSLLEECSKGVQSNELHVSEEPHIEPLVCNNETCMETCNKTSNINAKSCDVGCFVEDKKFNTYPKREHINPLKPLLRSNTDIGKMEKASHVSFDQTANDNGDRQNICVPLEIAAKTVSTETEEKQTSSTNQSSKISKICSSSKGTSESDSQTTCSKIDWKNSGDSTNENTNKDPLIDLIKDITKRYSKKDIEKSKRRKCFKELLTVLNYLLDTEDSRDSTDHEHKVTQAFTCETNKCNEEKIPETKPTKTYVDKAIQLTNKKPKKCHAESSDPTSTDLPTTSTDSAACQVLNKIKKECEKYYQKKCKSHASRKCEASSSTSVNCDQCRRVHHCYCKGYKCHKSKAPAEKSKRKCVAYNLILQSDSLVSEETTCDNNVPQLRNIVIKVPKRKTDNVPFREMTAKFEREFHNNIPHCARVHRSKSLPNDSEISSTDEMFKKAQALSVREYLEKNRPDFVERCSERQNSLKIVKETRTNERAAKLELLSMQVAHQPALKDLSESELRLFAKALSKDLRTKKLAPKFISERAMKKHSEKIYKSLPEVVRKKEELKKESIKKTNLLLASIFKKNLQKKTLQGAVNLSNYSTIIKI
ncbi:uncharacterized protein LOC119833717 [Zerene cesonia]|uniref:uncharacterized protein LOC119833717 n=1 Tax=Zerene cesonia TaxID=33412 RepID=UPI0018E4EB39|nr:uncharacterized protein LOC119833717 [Zerene cesonia]